MSSYAPPAVVIVPWTQPFAKTGTWARYQHSVYLGGGTYFSSGAVNESISYRVALGAGTYTLTAVGTTDINKGIATVALDGASVATVDWYGAALNNQVKTVTGIVVTTPGVYTLSLTAATKNASSSAYSMQYNLLALHRTDDASGPIVGGTLPHRVDIIPYARTQYAGSATMSIAQDSTNLSGAYCDVGSTQNLYAEYLVPLAAGTWTLTSIHRAGSSTGIATWSINGVSVGTIDHYNAITTPNTVATITGITIAQDGIYKLRHTQATKNASASAYSLRQHHHILQRTGS